MPGGCIEDLNQGAWAVWKYLKREPAAVRAHRHRTRPGQRLDRRISQPDPAECGAAPIGHVEGHSVRRLVDDEPRPRAGAEGEYLAAWGIGGIGAADVQALAGDGVEQAVIRSTVRDGDPTARRAKCDRGLAGSPRDDGEALVEPALKVPPFPPTELFGCLVELTARFADIVNAHRRHRRRQPRLVGPPAGVDPSSIGSLRVQVGALPRRPRGEP